VLQTQDPLTGHFGGCWFIDGEKELDDFVNGVLSSNSGGPADNPAFHRNMRRLRAELKAHPGFPAPSPEIG